MNSYDIFRKLTKGIKFDQKRFKGDLQKIGVFPKDGNKNVQSNTDLDASENFAEEPLPEIGEVSAESEMQVTESSVRNKEDEGGGIKILGDLHYDKSPATTKKKKMKKGDGSVHEKSEKERQSQIKQEEINHIRNKNGIHVWGSDIPEPVTSFEKLAEEYKVTDVIASNLRSQGYTEPMPIQMQAWPIMLQGREILGSAPTGSGKTAAFLVPILHHLQGPRKKGFRAVLLAPTRELARQTHRECVRLSEGLGFRVHIISNVTRARQKFGPKSSQKFDILVTTPNRLIHLLREGNAPVIDLSNVEWLVIDESDRLFEAGKGGFRDQLAIIYRACSNPNVTRALFSATFAHEVQKWCKLNLNNVVMVSVGLRNAASEDVKQELLFCGEEHGKLIALRDILRKGYKPPVLVFVQTKERAKELFRELIYDNIMVDAIHADRTQTQRDNVVRAFRERKIWVLICTELMARGIDFKGVNLVINYDFPPSVISYIHRVGRTGRAQHKGRAVTFWTMADKPNLQSIARVIYNARQDVPEWMLKLKKLSRYEKKQQVQNIPERGHVSHYERYRECSILDNRRKNRRRKQLEKKAAMGVSPNEQHMGLEANCEGNFTGMEEADGEWETVPVKGMDEMEQTQEDMMRSNNKRKNVNSSKPKKEKKIKD